MRTVCLWVILPRFPGISDNLSGVWVHDVVTQIGALRRCGLIQVVYGLPWATRVVIRIRVSVDGFLSARQQIVLKSQALAEHYQIITDRSNSSKIVAYAVFALPSDECTKIHSPEHLITDYLQVVRFIVVYRDPKGSVLRQQSPDDLQP